MVIQFATLEGTLEQNHYVIANQRGEVLEQGYLHSTMGNILELTETCTQMSSSEKSVKTYIVQLC